MDPKLFPRLYHAHHSRHPADLPFWKKLAERQGSPILELGCGTGRVLLSLAQVGRQVYGLDSDPAMLAFLKARIPAQLRSSVHFWQADLTSFRLHKQFALILLPCNTFSGLPGDGRMATLACVRRHLLPEGVFAVSLPNPRLLARLEAQGETEIEETFPHPLDGEPVQVSSAWEKDDQNFTLYWLYDHLLPDGRVDRFTVQVSHALVPRSTYLQELERAGLEVISTYGDYDFSAYRSSSPFLILVCKIQRERG